VHRRAKRLPPVAQAFKNFLLADGAALIDQALGVKKPATRAAPRTARRPR
jgi:LysR family transcriptional regulator, low CO2-responsive transcriptional regulator